MKKIIVAIILAVVFGAFATWFKWLLNGSSFHYFDDRWILDIVHIMAFTGLGFGIPFLATAEKTA